MNEIKAKSVANIPKLRFKVCASVYTHTTHTQTQHTLSLSRRWAGLASLNYLLKQTLLLGSQETAPAGQGT